MGLFLRSDVVVDSEYKREFEYSPHILCVCKDNSKTIINIDHDEFRAIDVPYYFAGYSKFIKYNGTYMFISTTKGTIASNLCIPMKNADYTTTRNFLLCSYSMSFIEALLTIYHSLIIDGYEESTKILASFGVESYKNNSYTILCIILSRIKFMKETIKKLNNIPDNSIDWYNRRTRTFDKLLSTKFDYLVDSETNNFEFLFFKTNLLSVIVKFIANFTKIQDCIEELCKMHNYQNLVSQIINDLYENIIGVLTKDNYAIQQMISELEVENKIEKENQ